MKPNSKADLLKMIGGGVVIAGACLIMFPDIIGYCGSIARLLLLVLVAILVAAFVARTLYKIKSPKPAAQAGSDQTAASASGTATDTESDT